MVVEETLASPAGSSLAGSGAGTGDTGGVRRARILLWIVCSVSHIQHTLNKLSYRHESHENESRMFINFFSVWFGNEGASGLKSGIVRLINGRALITRRGQECTEYVHVLYN